MRNRLGRIGMVLVAAIGLLAGVTTPAQAAPLYLQFVNYKADKCMSVEGGGSTAKGAEMIQWSCNDMTEQQWRIADDPDWPLVDGSYAKVLVNRKSGLVMSTPGGAWANNTKVIQWSYLANAMEQHWLQY